MKPTNSHDISRSAAMFSGILAGAVAIAIGELVGSFSSTWQSPVVGVATGIIDRVPRPVKDFGVEKFGTNDKLALVVGILFASVIFAAVLGVIARRRPLVSIGGFAAFAVVGIWGSQQPVGATPGAIIPSLAAGAGGIATLWLMLRVAPPRSMVVTVTKSTTETDADTVQVPVVGDEPQGIPEPVAAGSMFDSAGSRRKFLFSSAGVAVIAAAAATGGRALRTRFSAASSRRNVSLPRPAAPLAAAPAGVTSNVVGVSNFYTSNADFYRIDTAVEVPQILVDNWELRIHGMVDKEIRITFDELLKRKMVEQDITLTCVSNTVGGSLTGTARWLGVPLKDLLDEAGVDPRADQLVGRSVDGWTSGFPIATLDGRPALLAIGMNGEPLPLEHGFPARVIVSGIYGYVSATKWITELEVTTFDAFDAYWVKRGWDKLAPIKTQSRIDTPRTLAKVAPGTVNIGGVAWAQTVGISKVEVQIDDGPFGAATLADELNANTWRLWSMAWEGATPGRHRITVRATDANGIVQSEERADPFPNGASGWMSILVEVKAG